MMTVDYVSAAGGDPFWAQVVLLMDFEGANGGTTFVDSSSYNHTIQKPVAGITTSTTTADSGTTASGASTFNYLGSVNLGYLRVDETADEFNINTSDFTTEWSARRPVADTASGITIMSYCDNSGTDKLRIARTNTTGRIVIFGQFFTTWIIDAPFTTDDTWHKWCLERSGNVFSFYKDGTRLAQKTEAATLGNSPSWNIFAQTGGGDTAYEGFYDQIRVTVAARYLGAASYTTSSTAFPTF
jgi:hypothetical protein